MLNPCLGCFTSPLCLSYVAMSVKAPQSQAVIHERPGPAGGKEVLRHFFIFHGEKNNWLVVYLPLWKIWKSVGMIIPNIWKNEIHVPNHQPVTMCWTRKGKKCWVVHKYHE